MLTKTLMQDIQAFVAHKPRSIQEIAEHLKKNWRTADRYVDQISTDYGTLATRTFRQGTRGALKIVYLNTPDKISHTVFQEQLEQEIMRARKKEDFSAFDIYQYVPEGKKRVTVENENSEEKVAGKAIKSLYVQAKKQLLIFSGNLSFINFREGKETMFEVIERIAKQGVSIKIVCRVDLAGRENVEKILSLNRKVGKNLVEIRHRTHPLRATIIDQSCFDIKEITEPTGQLRELDKKLFIFYNITDKEWVEWLTKIFWRLFNASVDAEVRLKQLGTIT